MNIHTRRLFIVSVLSLLVFCFAVVNALTTEEARQVLSTGLNPDGTQATQAQLQEANQVYYGYYNSQPSVTSGTNTSDGSGAASTQIAGGACTGDTTIDYAAAQDCASKAQAQGTALGYNISCTVQINTFPGINPTTGLGFYLDPTCTVNGVSGQSAVLLAGYEIGPTSSSNPNAHPGYTNAGWSTLPSTLAQAAGSSTGGSGITTNSGTGSINITNATAGITQGTINTGGTAATQAQQSIISTLQNLVNKFQAQLNQAISSPSLITTSLPGSGTGTGAGVGNSCNISSDLRIGDSGAAVTALTTALKNAGFMSQAQSTFDATVFVAVIQYQEAHASDILTPVSLSKGTGFVGPSTRNYINSHATCGAGAVGTPPPSVPPSPATGDVAGTGSGNCSAFNASLSDGMKVVVLSGGVSVSDGSVAPNSAIIMQSPVVEQYDGWASVVAGGQEYFPSKPVNGTPTVSGQNHDALNLFHIVMPTLPVADGTDVTVKLYKALPTNGQLGTNNDPNVPPYVVQKTFKYYASSHAGAIDPYIMPTASIYQNYSQQLVAKCGGSVTWTPHVLSGSIPRGFDVTASSLTFYPANVYVHPQAGDYGIFTMWGTNGSQDVIQTFKVTVGASTGGSSTVSAGPFIAAVVPGTITASQASAGTDVTVSGQNFSATNGIKIEFKQGTASIATAPSFSITSPSSIRVRVPTNLTIGTYSIQITQGGLVATSNDPANQTLTVTQ